MSATRTAQAYPETQHLAAALGVVILAIAVMLVLAFGVLAAPKATVVVAGRGRRRRPVRPRRRAPTRRTSRACAAGRRSRITAPISDAGERPRSRRPSRSARRSNRLQPAPK